MNSSLEFEQNEAHHYNALMWTLINLGIGLTLWIFYQVYTNDTIQTAFKGTMISFGFLILLYFNIIIEKCNKRVKNAYDYICEDKKMEFKSPLIANGTIWMRIIILILFGAYTLTFNKLFGCYYWVVIIAYGIEWYIILNTKFE